MIDHALQGAASSPSGLDLQRRFGGSKQQQQQHRGPTVAALRRDMCSGPDALPVCDRWHRLRRYKAVFVASEFVDWVVARYRHVSRAQVRSGLVVG